MNLIGTHGQGCLTDEEYGAVALIMQSNRDAVDAALTQDQAALDAYNNRPWVQMVSTVAVAQAQTLLEWTPGTSWNGWQVITNTTSTNTVTGGGGQGADFTAGEFRTGWWNVGGYVSYQPTGAITNNSRRLMCIQINHTVTVARTYDTIIQTSFESNTGTDSMTVNDIFYLDNRYTYGIVLGFSHRNSGSNVQVNAGARIWANYIGTGVTL